MTIAFQVLFLLFLQTITFAQSSQYFKIREKLEKNNDISKVIYDLKSSFFKKNEKNCSVIDSLLTDYHTTNVVKYSILLFQKLENCIDKSKEEELNNILVKFESSFEKLPNLCDKAIFYSHLYWFFVEKENFKQATIYLDKAQKIVKNTDCKNYHLFVLLLEAQNFQKNNQNDLYLSRLIEAEKFYEDNNLSFAWAWFDLQNRLGYLYYNNENYSNTKKHWLKALKVAQKNQWKDRSTISTLNSLGLVERKNKNFQEAVANFQAASQMAENIRDSIWIAIPKGNIAEIDILQEKYEEAEKNLNVYLDFGQKYQEYGIVVAAFIKFAVLNQKQNNLEISLQYLKKAENYLQENQSEIIKVDFLSFLGYQKRLYETYTEIFEEKGLYDKALAYAKKFISIKDSINTVLSKQKIDELAGIYRFKEQEKENSLLLQISKQQEENLRKQQIIIWITLVAIILAVILSLYLYFYSKTKQKYAKILEKNNKFKDRVFSIVSHDLRNYMSNLKGFVYLLRNGEINRDNIEVFGKELSKNTEHAFSLLDNLLIWAKSQIGGFLPKIQTCELREVIQDLVFEIGWFTESKNIKIELEADEPIFVEIDKDILSLALRNIISNSVKFTKPNGNIWIKITRLTDTCLIKVQDNGIGISPENLDKIRNHISFTQRGTELEKGTGLGLQLIQIAIKQLNGKFSIDSIENQGTQILLEIPLSKNIPKTLNKNQDEHSFS
jgi:signal transduction histidine kinase